MTKRNAGSMVLAFPPTRNREDGGPSGFGTHGDETEPTSSATNEEAAQVLGISLRTAKYYWTHARAWLHGEMQAGAER